MTDALLPSAEAVRAGLTELFGAGLTILDRRPNPQASTFASERVTCRLPSGRTLALFCKHDGRYTPGDGHHGGVAYEAAVYERILARTPISRPIFHGAFRHRATGEITLVLEALDGATRVSRARAPDAMGLAAGWLGQLHRRFESAPTRAGMSFLRVYDAAYYERWADRTATLAAPLSQRYPWLTPLCRAFVRTLMRPLLDGATFVHGEFYPHNVLVRTGAVLPVDWESAAIAAGEVDLVALTENWSADVIAGCIRSYCRARWPGGAPAGLEARLTAARLYLHLRWLGDRAEWTLAPDRRWRFEQLRESAGRLGIG